VSEENKSEIYEAIAKAVMAAINEVGLDRFKQTSFFVSNVTRRKRKLRFP